VPSAPKPKFVELCRQMGLLTKASVAIDGSKFKAVNTRDKNFTKGKVERRRQQLEDSVARYLAQLDTADLQDPSEALAAKTVHLKDKLAKLANEMQKLVIVRLLGWRRCLSIGLLRTRCWYARSRRRSGGYSRWICCP